MVLRTSGPNANQPEKESIAHLGGVKDLAQIKVKKLITGIMFLGTVFLKLKNVTLLEMLIMSIALFGGYNSLIYFTFELTRLNIIIFLEILFLVIGTTFIILGLFESKIKNGLSRYRDTTYLKSIPTFIERLTVPGKVLWFLILVFMALFLPIFAINLSEVIGLTLGVYEYYAPSIFEGQKQYMPTFFLIFVVGIASECYIVLKIMGIWQKWRSGRSSPAGKSAFSSASKP